jgi:predicted RNA binding protein YcfA (HicA-like mRNA interferase family)
MPGKLRVLSGRQIVHILMKFGFEAVGQRGSHVKLRRITQSGQKQSLHIPLHGQLRVGTLHAIFRQASAYITEKELRAYFYSE